MTLTPQFMDELRSRLTLSDVVGARIKLTRAGREFKACCPFHKEKSPSFYVNDDKQFFHCFGCGAHGDAVGFVMRYENRSFPEAAEQLAALAGLKMPDTAPEDVARSNEQKSLYALMEAAALWFESQLALPKSADVMRYLTGRGLTVETINAFRLGYAPGDDRALYQYLKQAGFTDDQMVAMGLMKRRERDATLYGFFRDRVMFPVCDRSGRVIAFGGRVLPDHLRPPDRGSDFKPPKYLNSPETPLFHKGRTVYAQAQARAAAANGERLVVVEGYMDAIACHQAGVKGAVAPLGTALTEDQIALLWKMIPGQDKTITLCFDGDEAGRRAAARAADRILPLLKPDHSARIAFLPEGEDPDTLIAARGVMAFHQILDVGQGLADYVWAGALARRPMTRPEDRAGLESELDGIVSRILDPKTKYYYQKYFKDKLFAQFRPTPRPYTKGGAFLPPVARPVLERPQTADARGGGVLLATLIQHPKIFGQVDEIIGTFHIDDPETNRLRAAVIDLLSSEEFENSSDFQNRLRGQYPDLSASLDRVCSDQILATFKFTRPDVEDEEALAGIQDFFAQTEARLSFRRTKGA